ncbi:MarR family winged helix-turn-helix transcriptional regulator [Paenibacillus sp. 1P07SE]|uniref:MarR family winged helix-turn-helix transcriptional regulator n=1 Tax=Paenibacillus sp. 1P07SE TaxID=3132209 RepID=UPI0039A643B2
MPSDDRLGLLVWYRLSRAYNQSLRASSLHLKQWDLTVAQFDVLVQIGAQEGLTQQELGEKLFVTKGNVTQLLGKLEEQGWIRREKRWKSKHLSLTAKGRELIDAVAPRQERQQASHFHGLSKEEKKQLITLLKKVQPMQQTDDNH